MPRFKAQPRGNGILGFPFRFARYDATIKPVENAELAYLSLPI